MAGYSTAECKGLCCQLTRPAPRVKPRSDAKNNALEYATRDDLLALLAIKFEAAIKM